MEHTYKVYASLDGTGNITTTNSSAFLSDTTDWVEIDEGTGDRYHHAQGNYFEGGVFTYDGIPRYRCDGTQVIQRAEVEIEADRAAIPAPPISPTNAELMDAILELAELMMGGAT